jgi:hypothetical protein
MQNYGVPVASGLVAVGLYIWNTTQNDQTKNHNTMENRSSVIVLYPQATPSAHEGHGQALGMESAHSIFCVDSRATSAVYVGACSARCMQTLSTPLTHDPYTYIISYTIRILQRLPKFTPFRHTRRFPCLHRFLDSSIPLPYQISSSQTFTSLF